MTDAPAKIPPKSSPYGNYRRADYFERECEKLRAELELLQAELQREKNTPKAVSVVNPEGTEETGADRPAAIFICDWHRKNKTYAIADTVCLACAYEALRQAFRSLARSRDQLIIKCARMKVRR